MNTAILVAVVFSAVLSMIVCFMEQKRFDKLDKRLQWILMLANLGSLVIAFLLGIVDLLISPPR